MLDWALWFAHNGWPIFPAHGIVDGSCTCRKGPECSSPGKHPDTRRGWKDASLDPRQIREWYAKNPHANIALACGNITVLDIDGEKGRQSLESLLDDDRAAYLRTTPRARTGGGGWHLFFQGVEVKNLVGMKPGLDIRSRGGHVILPPSMHASGRRYSFDRCPTKHKVQPFPDWLLQVAKEGERDRPRIETAVKADPSWDIDKIPEIPSYRNNTLTSLCGTMFRRGNSTEEITATLMAINEARCKPPLDASDIEKIVWSVSRYH